MTRITSKLFVVALTAATLAIAGTADAGGCSSGGGFGGYGGGYGGYRAPSFPSYRTVRSTPIRSAPRVIESRPAQPQFQPRQQITQAQPQQQPQQTQAPAQTGLNALGGTQQAPAAGNGQTAEQSALQLLGAMGGTAQPQTQQPQAQAQPTNSNVGTWVAKVGDQATVRLELRADNTFTWTATRNGKTSNFSGNYSTQGGKLTLTRSDNQSLAGAMTINANGFNFKLDGAKDNGLTFARA